MTVGREMGIGAVVLRLACASLQGLCEMIHREWVENTETLTRPLMPLYLCVCVLVAQLCLTLGDCMNCRHQAPLFMKFSRQKYCSA